MDILTLINSVGFPIAVSIWFMVKLQPALDRNTQAITVMTEVVRKSGVKLETEGGDAP